MGPNQLHESTPKTGSELTILPTVRPWIDGEKIPDERVREIFRQPPGGPETFYRSSLVIGSRGVGKTTLLRYLKSIHEGIAVHISLHAELSSLTKQTGLGPMAFDFSRDLERRASLDEKRILLSARLSI